jgi:hypothetical protein
MTLRVIGSVDNASRDLMAVGDVSLRKFSGERAHIPASKQRKLLMSWLLDGHFSCNSTN